MKPRGSTDDDYDPYEITTVADQGVYTLPSDLLYITRVALEAGTIYGVKYPEIQKFIDGEGDTLGATIYSVNDTEFWLYPDETSGYTIEIWYVKKADVVTAYDGTIEIPDDLKWALVNRVMYHLAVMSDKGPQAKEYQSQYSKYVTDGMERSQDISGGQMLRIKPVDFGLAKG